MLIYNFRKEFLGIDEKDLNSLGLKDLEELRREASDFADLFVKTPGHIHNFQHVHWIDFITCAESSEESKVIISVNNKNYRATIAIETGYLVDSPSSKAYFVNLNHLRELTSKDTENISADIASRPTANVESTHVSTFDSMEPAKEHTQQPVAPTPAAVITEDPYETPLEVDFNVEDVPDEVIEPAPEPEAFDGTMNIEDLSLDVQEELTPIQEPVTQTTTTSSEENYDNGYVYDPQVASDELGLPLDLIEEFIGDFIEQAKEFKDNMYKALNEGDFDNLKILSHKLKGVAANLRIEDALEAISIINSTSDANVAEENLETFYKIVSKLAGETIAVTTTVEVPTQTIDEDELSIDFKEPESEPEPEMELSLNMDEDDDLYSDPIEISLDEEVTLADEPLDVPLDIETTLDEEPTLADEPVDVPMELEISSEVPVEAATEYSKESIANEIGLDNESFNELFDDYMDESGIISQHIKDALQSGDYATCSHEAMKLRGMSENMRITSFNAELKTIINSSNDQEIADAMNTIDSALAQISKTEA